MSPVLVFRADQTSQVFDILVDILSVVLAHNQNILIISSRMGALKLHQFRHAGLVVLRRAGVLGAKAHRNTLRNIILAGTGDQRAK